MSSDKQFALMMRDGFTEREMLNGDSLEELREKLEEKTGDFGLSNGGRR